jgi:hypothetical protein
MLSHSICEGIKNGNSHGGEQNSQAQESVDASHCFADLFCNVLEIKAPETNNPTNFWHQHRATAGMFYVSNNIHVSGIRETIEMAI